MIMLMAVLAAVMSFTMSTHAAEPRLAPSYAWSLKPPLGLRQPATIDTLYLN